MFFQKTPGKQFLFVVGIYARTVIFHKKEKIAVHIAALSREAVMVLPSFLFTCKSNTRPRG